MNPAPNLVLVGPTGAGKTSIGRRLAERFGLAFVDVDHHVEQAAGSSIARMFENLGEAVFREREREALAELLAGEGRLVSTGAGAVLDPANRALIRARGYVVHLHVGVDEQLRRLARDTSRPLLRADDRAATLHAMAQARTSLYRELADLSINTDSLTSADATGQLVLALARGWQRPGAAA